MDLISLAHFPSAIVAVMGFVLSLFRLLVFVAQQSLTMLLVEHYKYFEGSRGATGSTGNFGPMVRRRTVPGLSFDWDGLGESSCGRCSQFSFRRFWLDTSILSPKWERDYTSSLPTFFGYES